MTNSALLAVGLGAGVAGGAALFRLRGSETWREWTGRGLGSIRWLWAAYVGTCAWLLDNGSSARWACGLYVSVVQSADWYRTWSVPILLPSLIAALWFGCAIGPWWGSLDMGTDRGSVWRDLAMHSLRGVLWVAPAAAVLAVWGLGSPWPLLAVGLACGPVYLACWRLWPARRPIQRAEWSWGGLISAALLCSVAFS